MVCGQHACARPPPGFCARAALQDGSLDATVFHDPAMLAGETLRAAVALARGALDESGLPRRAPAISPPSRPMPVLDVPFRVVDRDGAAALAAFWEALQDGGGAWDTQSTAGGIWCRASREPWGAHGKDE
jgi:hypothetical protein